MKHIDMLGKTYGNLSVTAFAGHDCKKRRLWRYKCSCGGEGTANGYDIRSGRTKSCGKCGRNTYQHLDDYGIIVVSLPNGADFAICYFDEARISPFQWHVGGNGYVVAWMSGKKIFLHKFLMEVDDSVLVDHINRDKTDNRRNNLRVANKSLNGANAGVRCDNVVTGHKNVKYDRRHNNYAVRVTKDGITHYGGAYKDILDAVQAANDKRRELFGEFAYQDNYIEPLIGRRFGEMESL
jgi:hypothetical protein